MFAKFKTTRTIACTAAGLLLAAGMASAQANGTVVISKVFGGNNGSYNRDFIELFNRSGASVDISGWSLQYSSATGTSWGSQKVAIPAGTVLAPGKYYLLTSANASASGTNILAGDTTFTFDMSGTNGKLALVSNNVSLPTEICPTNVTIMDKVSWGTGNCPEGTAVGALSTTRAAFRKLNGCTDDGNNSADFDLVNSPTDQPKRFADAAAPCGGGAISGACCTGSTCTVLTDISTCTGTSFAGQTCPSGEPSFCITTGTCCVAGACTIVANAAACSGVFEAGFSTCAPNACPAPAPAGMKISQVYGGGGGGGSTYSHDYVELFNAGSSSQSLSGWSLQYGSGTGTSGFGNVFTLPAVTVAPGQFYLVQFGATGATPMPVSPDATSSIALGAASGKLGLFNVTASQVCGSAAAVDVVGWGDANCFETSPATGSSTTAALIRTVLCTDTNNNSADFAAGTPNPRNQSTTAVPCSTGPAGPSVSNTTIATSACPTDTVEFTVSVTPGNNTTITSVVGDFSAIGGSSSVAFNSVGSGNYSISLPIGGSVNPGNVTIPVTATDGASLTNTASIALTINNCNLRLLGAESSISPNAVCVGTSTLIRAVVKPATVNPSTPSSGITATADLSAFGGSNATSLPFVTTTPLGDSVFELQYTVPTGTAPATNTAIVINVADAQSRTAALTLGNLSSFNCVDAGSTVVISQVYGGGGNSGSVFSNDYVELFNRSAAPVDITGWSVQYASATGAGGFAAVTELTGTIPAGGYYLVQYAAGANPSVSLPTPDAVSTTNMSGSAGRVALVRNASPLGTNCGSTDVADLVGYGTGSSGAACFEGERAASTLDNEFAAIRKGNGCQDFNQNGVDFARETPTIVRNSASAASPCSALPTPPAVSAGSASPANACTGVNVTFSVNVTPGANAVSTVVGNFSSIGGGSAVAFTNTSGTTWSTTLAATVGTTPGAKSIIVTATDVSAVSGSGNISFTVDNCTPTNVVCCRGTTCTLVPTSGDCTVPATPIVGASISAATACGVNNSTANGCCFADFTKSSGVNIDDIFVYLNAWFASSPFTDIGGDGSSTPNIDDIFIFLNSWFAGCPS